MKKILMACFSASGRTMKMAKKVANEIGADWYQIQPEKPYTQEDLDWTNGNSRSSMEMKNKTFRPKLIEDHLKIEDYKTIFIAFPIWWYTAPTIINTFLERYDFSDKKIVLLATSGGSGFGKTIDDLKVSVGSTASIVEGKLLNGNITEKEIDGLKSLIL